MTTAGPPNDAVLGPVDALRRTAYVLERGLDSSRRIGAFRKAAAVLDALPTREVEQRAKAGTLTELPGIGERTAEIATEAVQGRRPSYLHALEQTQPWPLIAGGEPVRAALRGDLHAHTDWSDGTVPLDQMVATAAQLGHEYIAITDHSPRLTIANGLSVERLQEQLRLIDGANAASPGVRVLKGIEVDILEDGGLDQTEDMLAQLDIRVVSVHSKLRMERDLMTRRMVAAIRHPLANVLGHCTGQLVTGGRGKRPQSQFDAEAVFAACVEHNVAVEINSRPERMDPPDELIVLARDMGCLFSIDTDSHAPGQMEFLDIGAARATVHDIPLDRIVTTWPAERLLAWANPHRT